MPEFMNNINLPKIRIPSLPKLPQWNLPNFRNINRTNFRIPDFSYRKFLGCIRLELGGLIIGVIEILLTLCVVIYEMIPHERELIEFDGKAFLYERLEVIISGLISLISAGLLITGIVKRNHFLMLPWLTTATLILLVILFFDVMFIIFTRRLSSDLIVFWISIITLVWYGYNWFICFIIYNTFSKEYHEERIQRLQRSESRVILTEVVISEND